MNTVQAVAAAALAAHITAAAHAIPLTGDPVADGWSFRGNTLQEVDPIYFRHTDGPGASEFTPDRVQDFDFYTQQFRLTDEVPLNSIFQANDAIIGIGFVLNDVAPEDNIAWSEGFFAVDFNNNSYPTSAPGSNYTLYADTAALVGDAGDVHGFVDANPDGGPASTFEVELWNIVDGVNSSNAPYPASSSDIPATVVVQTDVEPDIGAGRLGMTRGQFLINYSAIERARGSFAGQQEGELGETVTLRLAFLENFGAGADAAVTVNNLLTLTGTGGFASGSLDGWTVTSGGGTAEVIDQGGDDFAALLTTGSPVALSTIVDTPNGPFNLLFDYQFLTTTGSLEVLLDGMLLDTIAAPPVLPAAATTRSILVDDASKFGKALELTFDFDGLTDSQVIIDDVGFGPAASSVPEPTTAAGMLLALSALGLRRRR